MNTKKFSGYKPSPSTLALRQSYKPLDGYKQCSNEECLTVLLASRTFCIHCGKDA